MSMAALKPVHLAAANYQDTVLRNIEIKNLVRVEIEQVRPQRPADAAMGRDHGVGFDSLQPAAHPLQKFGIALSSRRPEAERVRLPRGDAPRLRSLLGFQEAVPAKRRNALP